MKYNFQKRSLVTPLPSKRKRRNVFTLLRVITPLYWFRKLPPRKRLFANAITVGSLLVLIPLIVSQLLTPDSTSAAWFNDQWQYRQTVSVTNSSAALNYSQIPLTVNTSALITDGKMRSDCRDIRVTSSTGKLLKHWVHECNTTSTKIYAFALNVPSGGSNFYIYYGNPQSGTNTEVITGTTQFPGISCKTIYDHNDGRTNKSYVIDPNAGSPSDAFTTYCDMTTDSGGWTIVHSMNGTISQQGLTSNTEVSGNPFSNASSNISTLKKQDVSLISSESLLKRSNGKWLKLNIPLFDANLTTASQHPHNTNVTITADDGTSTSSAVVGYSNFNNTNGGDFGITTAVGFDHHNTTYYHLRSGCTNHYLYKYGTTYNVNTTLGSWTQTVACGNNSTSMGAWYSAMRGTITPIIANITIGNPANEEQSPGPVAYWSMDEGAGTTVFDKTTRGNNGTISGASWKPASECKVGKCLYFDGTNDSVNFGNISTTASISGNLTISFWMKATNITKGRQNPIGKAYGGEFNMTMETSGSLSIYHGSAGTDAAPYTQVNSSNVIANNWTHVVYTRDTATRTVKVYLNGKLDKNQTYSSTYDPVVSTRSLRFGYEYAGYYQGYLDEVILFPTVKSAEEVKALYSSGNAGTAAIKGISTSIGTSNQTTLNQGLVAYWKMDESTADSCTGGVNDSCDSSGNGLDVSWSGDLTASSSGRFGNGTFSDGSGDYISLGNAVSSTSKTYALWVRPSDTQGTNREGLIGENTGSRIDYGNGAGSSSFHALVLLTSGSPAYRELTATGNGVSQWTHIVLTIDDENKVARFYANGELKNTATWTSSQSVSDQSADYIGYLNSLAEFHGIFDEARIYKRALSQDEVRQLYSYAPDPILYYNFEEKSGSSVNDKSGSGLTGTWNGTGTKWSQGQYGGGGNFDGTSNYVSSTGVDTSNTSFTLGAWIFPTRNNATWRHIFGADITGYALGIDGSNNLRLTRVSRSDATTSNYSPPLNKWTYVAVTYDAPTTRVTYYADGKQVASSTYAGTPPDAGAKTRYIGRSPSYSSYFYGRIDDTKIYNYVRSQSQIVEDMNAGHPIGGSPIGSQVVYLKMNELTGANANNSGNSPTLTGSINGSVWTKNGKSGGALDFDGIDDYVQITDTVALDLTSEWTVGGWFRPDETTLTGSDRQVLISKWQTSAGTLINYYLYINTAGKAVGTVGNGSASQSVTSTTTLSPNNWYHIMATFNGTTGNLKIYINGKNEATTATGYSAAYANTGNVRLGQYDFAWSSYRDEYNGLMDDVKIYGAALTDDQIKIDYSQNASLVMGSRGTESDGITPSNSSDRQYCPPGDTTATCGPVAEWKFDEKSGATVNDTSGNANTGTITGASWTQGKIGSGLSFNGTSSYVSVSDPSNGSLDIGPNQDFTVGFWIKGAGTGSRKPLAKFNVDSSSVGWGFYHSSSTLYMKIGDGNSSIYEQGITNALDGRWHHIMYTLDRDGNCSRYKDGVLIGTTSCTSWASTDLSNSNNLFIGSNIGPNGYFQGEIDHIQIYNYVRTAAQIAWDYNRGKPIAHYKMDECQGTTLNDASGNGLAGTITIGGTGSQTSVGTCQTSSTAWGNGATGKFNSSFNFDGTDDYFQVSQPNIQTSPNNFTITGFIKPGSQDGFLITPNSNGIDQYVWYDVDLQRLAVNVATSADTNVATYYSRSNSVPTSTWTHFAVSINNRTVKIYINGKLDSTNTHGFDIGGWTSTWRIGQRGNSTFWFAGSLDDLQIFNYELTANQLKNILNQGGAIRFGPSSGIPQ